MRYFIWVLFLIVKLANASDLDPRFMPAEVIKLANLSVMLSDHKNDIVPGAADGRAIISPYVMILNGEQLVTWLKSNDYSSHSGVKAVRRYGKNIIEVEVDIFSRKNKDKLRLILYANGELQGVG